MSDSDSGLPCTCEHLFCLHYVTVSLHGHLCIADVVRELTVSGYKYMQEWCGSSL